MKSIFREIRTPFSEDSQCAPLPGPTSPISYDTLLLIAAIALTYIVSYLTAPNAPGLHSSGYLGWIGWYDQGQYYKTARDLSHLHLAPSMYWYGYPLLGALTYRFLPRHCFLIPDLIMVCAMITFFYAVASRLISKYEALILAYASFVLDPLLWHKSLIPPWNTIPVYLAVFGCSWLMLFSPKRDRNHWPAALLLGLAAFCRPPDLLALLAIYYFGLFGQPQKQRLSVSRLLAPIFTLGIALSLQFSAQLYLYRSFSSPYLATVGANGFDWHRLWLKTYQWLVDPTLLSGSQMLPPGTPLRGAIDRLPYLLIILPGLCLMVHKIGRQTLGVVAALLTTGILYLGFNPFNYPPASWSYQLFHYVWWFAPWAALWAWLTISRAWWLVRSRYFILFLLLPVVILTIFSLGRRTVSVLPISRLTSNAVNPSTETGSVLARLTRDRMTLRIPLPVGRRVDSICIEGNPAVPFSATVAGSWLNFNLSVNGRRLAFFHDYLPLGTPHRLYLPFINRPLAATRPTILYVTITANGLERCNLTSVSCFSVGLMPGANLRRWLKRF